MKRKYYLSLLFAIGTFFLLFTGCAYFNHELPSATDIYVNKTKAVDKMVDSLKTTMDDEATIQITVFLEAHKNDDGDTYRMSVIKQDGSIKYYEKLTDFLDKALANQLESMFNSRVIQIQAILDTQGGYVCVFTEESYDYLGSINRLAYASNGEEFTAFMSDKNYQLLKQYSANWFYYVGY